MRELSPVISRDGLFKALDDGGSVVVVCVETVSKFSNIYKGAWKFYVLTNVDGDEHKLLYVHGREIKPRVIKTSSGLMSFAIELGMNTTSIPHNAGEEVVWKRADVAQELDDKNKKQ